MSSALAPPCTIGTISAESDDDNPRKKATNVMIRITGTLPIKEYLINFHFFIVFNTLIKKCVYYILLYIMSGSII